MARYSKKIERHNFDNFKKQFQELANFKNERFKLIWEERHPILNEKNSVTGFDRHYIYHTAWAARKIKEINPTIHHDFSSHIYFSTFISTNYKVEYHDFNTPNLILENLNVSKADLTNLSEIDNCSLLSVSSMHVIEHIGLGRYGDKLDYDGDIKAISELKRVLAPNGNLLFVVPIGTTAKIMFNAHRIYSHQQILEYFSEFELKEFVLIPENPNDGHLVKNPSKELLDIQNYACGCYWFRK